MCVSELTGEYCLIAEHKVPIYNMVEIIVIFWD